MYPCARAQVWWTCGGKSECRRSGLWGGTSRSGTIALVRGSFEISRYAGGRPTARQWRCIASPTYSSFIAIKLILTTRPNGRLVTAADTPRTRTIVATPVDEHQHLETKASVLPAGAAVGESAREEVADMRDEKPAAAAPHEAHSHQAKMGTGGTTRQMGPPRLKSRGQ